MDTLISLTALLASIQAFSNAQQCNRLIQIDESGDGTLTTPRHKSGVTCLSVSPPVDVGKYVLLKVPAALSVTLDGKSYESDDAVHSYCLVLTPFKRCPLWHENIRDDCPGGSDSQPIFGTSKVYLKPAVDSPQDGSNETTIEYRLINRYDGFISYKCTDVVAPTVLPTTDSTLPDTTVPVTSSITKDVTTFETSTTQETESPTTNESVQDTTEIFTGTTNSNALAIISGVLGPVVILCIVLIVLYARRLKERKQDICCPRHDSEKGPKPRVGPAESRHRLVSENSNISTPPGGSHDTVCYHQGNGVQ